MKQRKLGDAKRAETWLVEAEQEKPTASIFPVASVDEEFLKNDA